MITLYFDKLYSCERLNEPCAIGIPFPKGVLFKENRICVIGEEGEVPSQKKVTGRYGDGSIRWVFVRFLATLPANEKKTYQMVWENEEERELKDSEWAREIKEGLIEVNAGKLYAVIGGESLFQKLTYGEMHYQMEGPVLIDGDGKKYVLSIERTKLIENGPVCAVVEIAGTQKAEDGKKRRIGIQLRFYRENSWFELAYRITNDSKEDLQLKELKFCLKMEGVKKDVISCAASSNYQTKFRIKIHKNTKGEGGAQRFFSHFLEGIEEREERKSEYVIDGNSLLYESNEHMAEVFYGTLFGAVQTEEGGAAVTVYQAHQNFPKAIFAGNGEVNCFLVPEGKETIVLRSGMAREQKVMVELTGPQTTLYEIDSQSLIYQMPDRPFIAPEVYERADVFLDVFVKNRKPEVERAFVAKIDQHARCYGMLNWGDTPDSGYTKQGRGNGELVWSNNEYDYPHACMLQYIRTGKRRFLDDMLVAASHWMDVDICHYSEDEHLLGGQWEHTRGHCVDGRIVCSHQWVEGLLDYYHMTGETYAKEMAIGIGENVKCLLELPIFQKMGAASARETGWALRTLTALYMETNEESWLSKCDWIVEHFSVWMREYGGWLMRYTDNTMIRVPFMIAVAVGSLMRYYRVRKDNQIKKMVIDAVKDLIENAYEKEYGVFYYKELPSLSRLGNNTLVLEALAFAAELTGDMHYLEYGRVTFEEALKSTEKNDMGKKLVSDALIVGSAGTKSFAQSFYPLVFYYRMLMDEEK